MPQPLGELARQIAQDGDHDVRVLDSEILQLLDTEPVTDHPLIGDDVGGALAAVENAYLKQQLVASNARRLRRIESGEQVVVVRWSGPTRALRLDTLWDDTRGGRQCSVNDVIARP